MRAGATPDGRGTTPDGRNATPDRAAGVPERPGAAPDEPGTTPDERDTTPDERGGSPDGRSATPDEHGESPGERGSAAGASGPDLGPVRPIRIFALGLLAALRAAGLVLVAEAIARGIAGAASGALDARAVIAFGVAGAVLRAAAGWATQVAARRLATEVKTDLRSRLWRRIADGSGGRSGGIAVLAGEGLDDLDDYYTQSLPAMVAAVAVPALVGLRILSADAVSAVVVVLTVPLVPVFMILIGRHTQERTDEATGALTRLADHLAELARGLPVLVGLGRVEQQTAALDRLQRDYRRRTMRTLRTAFLSSLALELIAMLSVALVAVLLGLRLMNGTVSLEPALVALILAPEIFGALREVGAAFHASQAGLAALKRAKALLARRPGPDVRTPAAARAAGSATGIGAIAEPRQNPADSAYDERRGLASGRAVPASALAARDAAGPVIRIAGLTVRYAGRDTDVVADLDADLAGITAITGPSGAGKSTVLAALAGVLPDDAEASGRIEFPGGAVSDAAPAECATAVPAPPVAAPASPAFDPKTPTGPSDAPTGAAPAAPAVAWVPQSPRAFARTPREELALYGATDPSAALAEVGIAHAADAAVAEISPGELRRLAVARALARVDAGAEVLVLDEPTAHLDRAAADLVRAAVLRRASRAVVVLASHEPETLALAARRIAVGPLAGERTAAVGAAGRHDASETAAGRAAARTTPGGGAVTAPDVHARRDSSASPGAPASAPMHQASADAAGPLRAQTGTGASASHATGGVGTFAPSGSGAPTSPDAPAPSRGPAASGISAPSAPVASSGAPATSAPARPAGGRSALGVLRELARPTGWRWAGAIALGFLASALGLSLTALSGWLIVRASVEEYIAVLMVAIVGVRFFGLGRAVARYAERLATHSAAFRAIDGLRDRMWRAIASRGAGSRRLLEGGSPVDYLVTQADELRDQLPRALPPLAVGALSIAAVTATTWFVARPLAPLVGAVLVAALIAGSLLAVAAERRAGSAGVAERAAIVRGTAALADATDDLRGNSPRFSPAAAPGGHRAPGWAASTRDDAPRPDERTHPRHAGAAPSAQGHDASPHDIANPRPADAPAASVPARRDDRAAASTRNGAAFPEERTHPRDAALAVLDAAAGRAADAERRAARGAGVGAAVAALATSALAAVVAPIAVGHDIPADRLAVIALLALAVGEHLAAAIAGAQRVPALRAGLRRVAGLLDPAPPALIGTAELDGPTRAVELDGLAAGYPAPAGSPGAAPAPVFAGLSAVAERGSRLVVTGPSGSGKSTLLSVLMGALPAADGEVRANGTPLAALSAEGWQRRVAWCPQQAHVFDSTLRGNLALARDAGDAASNAEMRAALRLAGLGGLVDALADGLDSRVGPAGSSLSGGERQRLAVARALLSRADVLLLDEPTAHLDAPTSRTMMADIRAAASDRVTVLVTHRADDIRPGDHVASLEGRTAAPRTARSEPVLSGV